MLSRIRMPGSAAAGRDSNAMGRIACWLVPVLCGLLSLKLGQDDNWDLKNYHFYNAYAFLNGKIGFDLAPAQWQSYFNPSLDLLYYGLVQHLRPRVAGFAMGLLHGLNFCLVLAIYRRVLPSTGTGALPRTTLWLAVAAMLGTAFLSQMGNSMGDNLTALFVLGAIWHLLRRWDLLLAGGGQAWWRCLVAGLIMGLGCGLKLTNATYAVALCLGLLAVQVPLASRVMLMLLFGIGVLAGMAATAGHWFLLMYQTFGNPLFPQFNDIFHAPLAAPIGVGDTGWRPKSAAESLLWPFIFALHPQRVSELPFRLWVWPLVYLGFIAYAMHALVAAARRMGVPQAAPAAPAPPLRQAQLLLLIFFAVSYLVWLKMFAIYRYLVPLELLLPAVLYLLFTRLLPTPHAPAIAVTIVIIAALCGLPRGSWGHAGWAEKAFSADTPALADPSQSMVLTVHGDPPLGWLATQFPATLAFVSVGSGFPDSPAYVSRLQSMASSRKGPLFAMMQADRAAGRTRSEAELGQARAANAAVLARADEVLARYGFHLLQDQCTLYKAAVGATPWNYQLCRVELLAGAR